MLRSVRVLSTDNHRNTFGAFALCHDSSWQSVVALFIGRDYAKQSIAELSGS
jgi:hypothetical protein